MGWLLILGGFMIVSAITSRAAYNIANPTAQYAGLFGLAAAEALIFAPFLWYVFNVRDAGGSVVMAAITTLIGFAALTVVAMVDPTRSVVHAPVDAVGWRGRHRADCPPPCCSTSPWGRSSRLP